MTQTMTRRQLFRSITGQGGLRRPPGAVPEKRFMELCDGCGKCIAACASETGALTADGAGAPVLDFSKGHCLFCGDCLRACETGALDASLAGAVEDGAWRFPWRMEISETACMEFSGVTCRMCESACEERAIRFRPMPGHITRAWIAEDACNGCGECLPRCPREAIVIVETPEGNTNRECAA
jgi:ferredoxin-type protein NapF